MTATSPAVSKNAPPVSTQETPHITTRWFNNKYDENGKSVFGEGTKEGVFAIRINIDANGNYTYFTENTKFITVGTDKEWVISDTCPVAEPSDCSVERAKREFEKNTQRIAAGAPDKKTVAKKIKSSTQVTKPTPKTNPTDNYSFCTSMGI